MMKVERYEMFMKDARKLCLLYTAVMMLVSVSGYAEIRNRALWMRGALGLNWKPARFGDGFCERGGGWMSIEPFLTQIEELDKVDYIQLHLNESSAYSHSHAAPHARIESMMGDKLVVPRAASGKDPFGNWLKACKARKLKTMVYVHSGGLVYGKGVISKRWKEYCDDNPDVQKFIASKPYHKDSEFPNRHYMFAYGEFVLKEYSERYGTLIDSWCFDKAKLVAQNGDRLSNKSKIDDQRLFENWANACRAGNPDACVAFNHGVGSASNPFNMISIVADFTFGHPFGGIGSMTGNPSIYKRNFSFCEKMKKANGLVFKRDKYSWNDLVMGHFDPKMSTTRWNNGQKPCLTNEQFLEWNQVGLAGGAITWGVPLKHSYCNRKRKRPDLTAKPWAFKQLKYMNDRLIVGDGG